MKETVLYTAPDTADSATLYVIDKSAEIQTYSLGEYTKIGRNTSTSDATVKLDSCIASRQHGEIQRMDSAYFYRDIDSLNGTYINGTLYGKEAPDGRKTCKLQDGDALRIDQKNLNFNHEDAVLMIFLLGDKPLEWNEQELTDSTGNIEIGRDTSKEDGLHLTDETISRKHATFIHGVNGWSIMDHGSKNGVYVNNVRIENATPLHRLDVVRIANTTFIFLGNKLLYNAKESENNQLVIRIAERSVKSLFKKHVILQNINLSINPGEMVLILGGSGAGKTTFFNAVMGYEKADGQIMHGDTDIYKDYNKMKYQIGFVPQQDLIRDEDTVYNTLDNSAKMKMPKGTTPQELKERIDYVLELLGLQRERNSLVKKLSGGQKKRFSIAIEFIANPSLFFLDEPDSGLDGIMATSLMENLRVIADEGKIVMIITHAPDRVAHLFDKVIVLAKSAVTNSGHLAYYGSIADAKEFFDADSLEGIVKRINRPDEGGDGKSDYYIDKYKALTEGEN